MRQKYLQLFVDRILILILLNYTLTKIAKRLSVNAKRKNPKVLIKNIVSDLTNNRVNVSGLFFFFFTRKLEKLVPHKMTERMIGQHLKTCFSLLV